MSLTPQQPMPAMPAMPTLPAAAMQAVTAAVPPAVPSAKRTKEEIASAILAATSDDSLKQVVAKKKPWYAIFSSSASSRLISATETYKKEFAAKQLSGVNGTGDKAAKAEQAAEEALVKTLEPIVQELAPEQQEAARQTLVDAARKHAIDEAKQERTALIDKEGAKIVTKNNPLFKDLAKATGNAAETQKIKAILTAKVTEATKRIKGITPEEIEQEVAKITAVSPQQADVIAEANKSPFQKFTGQVESEITNAVKDIPGTVIKEVKTAATTGLPPGANTALNFAGKFTGGRTT